MSIIISQKGKHAQKIDQSSFAKEDHLQKYIYDNPESIPLYDIKEDIKLLILVRELPTGSGPIDALAVDKYGDIYLIETKLYKNQDKRQVVAQVLDYGASLWKTSIDFQEFTATLEQKVNDKWQTGLQAKLEDVFSLEDNEIQALLDTMRANLNEGNFKFVVLMDQLHDQLKDLILFINQNSRFDIYAVEMEYYKYEDFEITIPRLFGTEVKKTIDTKSTGKRKKWNEQSLLEDAKQNLTQVEFDAFLKIYNFCKDKADKINYGTGSYGTFSPIFSKVSPMSVFTLGTDKRLSFNFEWTANHNLQFVDLLKTKLEAIGFVFPDNYQELRPSVLSDEWLDKTDKILAIFREII